MNGATAMKNRQWLLARRPQGAIEDSDFQFVETDVPAPGAGEVLVRNLMLSCDPAQRMWLAVDTYVPAVKIGEVVRSGGAGRIEASNAPGFAVGDIVFGTTGWQDYVAMNPKGLNKLSRETPLELAMSALGANGLSAYFGLLDVGRPAAGETVVVSGAAGATGSIVGQIAKIKDCRAIGIAGGPQKCRWLTDELGFDAAIDYRSDNVRARLKELCPNGIDIYFDNVGGDILDAALKRLAMSRYTSSRHGAPARPRDQFCHASLDHAPSRRLRHTHRGAQGLPGHVLFPASWRPLRPGRAWRRSRRVGGIDVAPFAGRRAPLPAWRRPYRHVTRLTARVSCPGFAPCLRRVALD
jgi:NADPH-dependent curcumin reductase CurA